MLSGVVTSPLTISSWNNQTESGNGKLSAHLFAVLYFSLNLVLQQAFSCFHRCLDAD